MQTRARTASARPLETNLCTSVRRAATRAPTRVLPPAPNAETATQPRPRSRQEWLRAPRALCALAPAAACWLFERAHAAFESASPAPLGPPPAPTPVHHCAARPSYPCAAEYARQPRAAERIRGAGARARGRHSNCAHVLSCRGLCFRIKGRFAECARRAHQARVAAVDVQAVAARPLGSAARPVERASWRVVHAQAEVGGAWPGGTGGHDLGACVHGMCDASPARARDADYAVLTLNGVDSPRPHHQLPVVGGARARGGAVAIWGGVAAASRGAARRSPPLPSAATATAPAAGPAATQGGGCREWRSSHPHARCAVRTHPRDAAPGRGHGVGTGPQDRLAVHLAGALSVPVEAVGRGCARAQACHGGGGEARAGTARCPRAMPRPAARCNGC